MFELDRSQVLSLAAAGLTLVVAAAASTDLLARVLLAEAGCLTFIWCSEMIGRFIGLGITQETPGCFVAAFGWALQVMLLVTVTAFAVARALHR